jgi:hypothetical protein
MPATASIRSDVSDRPVRLSVASVRLDGLPSSLIAAHSVLSPHSSRFARAVPIEENVADAVIDQSRRTDAWDPGSRWSPGQVDRFDEMTAEATLAG